MDETRTDADDISGDRARDLPSLLEALYNGLTRDPPWEVFLTALADAADASFATLLVSTRGAGIDAHVTPGVDPDRADEYDKLSHADPFVGLPEGQVVAFTDFVQHVPARFRQWLDKARTRQVLGVDLHAPSGAWVRLRVTRDDSRPDFAEEDRTLLASLIPHLRIALDLHARLTSTQAERQVFSSAMDGLAVATLILARDGRILRRNDVAARMLAEGHIIAASQGRLVIRHVPTLIDRLLANPPAPEEDVHVELVGEGGAPIKGLARVLPANVYGDGAHLALFLADPARANTPDPDMLRERFPFTPTEAALAARLLDGGSLIDAARALDMAHNTARSHLRAIFAKTGTHRQAELVHLLRATSGAFSI